MIGKSKGETNFLHKLLLSNTQVTNLRKAFTNNLLANITLLETHLFKIVLSGGFLVDFFVH